MVYTRLSKTRPSVRAVVQKRNEEVSVKSGEKVDSSTKAQPESERPMPEYSSSGWDKLKARFQTPGETIAVQASGDSPQIQLARKKSFSQRTKKKAKVNQLKRQQSPTNPINQLGVTLSQALKRKFSNTELQLASQGKLNQSDLEQLVRHLGSWNKIKANFIDHHPALMKEIIKFRQAAVYRTAGEVRQSDEKFQKLDIHLSQGQGKILGKLNDMVAAGSTDLSSDYDVTFSAINFFPGISNESLEILAVERFNQFFRRDWQKESGIIFDTNVYTSGHMRPDAFKADGVKLSLVNKIIKIFDKLAKDKKQLTAKEQAEINKLVAKVNGINTEGVPIRFG